MPIGMGKHWEGPLGVSGKIRRDIETLDDINILYYIILYYIILYYIILYYIIYSYCILLLGSNGLKMVHDGLSCGNMSGIWFSGFLVLQMDPRRSRHLHVIHRCHSQTSSQVPMMVLLVATAASFTFLDLSLEASKILGKAETRKGSAGRPFSSAILARDSRADCPAA